MSLFIKETVLTAVFTLSSFPYFVNGNLFQNATINPINFNVISNPPISELYSTDYQTTTIFRKIINDIIQSVPFTFELTSLIKENDIQYHAEFLNSPKRTRKYKTSFQKAMNFGVYSTDLKYAKLFGKNHDAGQYLDAGQSLAKGLRLSLEGFLEYRTNKNSQPITREEVIATFEQKFKNIQFHLVKQKKTVISLLILTGVWLEAMNLACQSYQTAPKKGLVTKIGEQKPVINQLLLALNSYHNAPHIQELIDSLRMIQKVYDQVKVETFIQPEMLETDGELFFFNKKISIVQINDQELSALIDLIGKTRTKYTK